MTHFSKKNKKAEYFNYQVILRHITEPSENTLGDLRCRLISL